MINMLQYNSKAGLVLKHRPAERTRWRRARMDNDSSLVLPICPDGARLIPLSSRKYPGLFTIVDQADYEILSQYGWWPKPSGVHRQVFYAARRITQSKSPTGKAYNITMHRQIMTSDSTLVVDHINHDGLDNRKINLRAVSQKINMQNKRKPNKLTGRSYRIFKPRVHKKLNKSGKYSYIVSSYLFGNIVGRKSFTSEPLALIYRRESNILKQYVARCFPENLNDLRP